MERIQSTATGNSPPVAAIHLKKETEIILNWVELNAAANSNSMPAMAFSTLQNLIVKKNLQINNFSELSGVTNLLINSTFTPLLQMGSFHIAKFKRKNLSDTAILELLQYFIRNGESCDSLLFSFESKFSKREYINKERLVKEILRRPTACIRNGERLDNVIKKFGVDPNSILHKRLEDVTYGTAKARIFNGESYAHIIEELQLSHCAYLKQTADMAEAKNCLLNGDTYDSVYEKFPGVMRRVTFPDLGKIALFGPARTRILTGEDWRTVARDFRKASAGYHDQLQQFAVLGPAKARVLSGESWKTVAKELGIDGTKARRLLGRVALLGVPHTRMLDGESLIKIAKEYGFTEKAAEYEMLQVQAINGPAKARILKGEPWLSVAAAYNFISGTNNFEKIEQIVAENIALPRILDGESIEKVTKELSLHKNASVYETLEMAIAKDSAEKRVHKGESVDTVAQALGLRRGTKAYKYLKTLVRLEQKSPLNDTKPWRAVAKQIGIEPWQAAYKDLQKFDASRSASKRIDDDVSWKTLAQKKGFKHGSVNYMLLQTLEVLDSASSRLLSGESWHDLYAEFELDNNELLCDQLEIIAAQGPAKKRLLDGEPWYSVLQAYPVGQDEDSDAYRQLKQIAIEGPAKTRILNGEPWYRVADAYNLYEDNLLEKLVEIATEAGFLSNKTSG